MTGILDISEGSRLEVTGIETLGDMSGALNILYNAGAFTDSPVHSYLKAGSGLTLWTTDPHWTGEPE
jgi:hypothetical protein